MKVLLNLELSIDGEHSNSNVRSAIQKQLGTLPIKKEFKLKVLETKVDCKITNLTLTRVEDGKSLADKTILDLLSLLG